MAYIEVTQQTCAWNIKGGGAGGLGFTLAGQPSDAETFRAKFAQWDINESTGAEPFGAGPDARG